MTREEAESLVEDLVQACFDYERAEKYDVQRAREEYRRLKEVVIAALATGD